MNPIYETHYCNKAQSVEIMTDNMDDNPIRHSEQEKRKNCDRSAENHESSLSERVGTTDEESGAAWMNEEDAWFLLSTILSGRICRPTPFDEIEQDCPAVWRSAVQAFAGDESAAREWLETRSPLFDGRRPLAVAMQIGGRRKVLQELKKLSNMVRNRRKRATHDGKK